MYISQPKPTIMKLKQIILVICSIAILTGCQTEEWISLFDGETMEGWKASEDPESWKIEDGAIVTVGNRSHLFYAGDVLDHSTTGGHVHGLHTQAYPAHEILLFCRQPGFPGLILVPPQQVEKE